MSTCLHMSTLYICTYLSPHIHKRPRVFGRIKLNHGTQREVPLVASLWNSTSQLRDVKYEYLDFSVEITYCSFSNVLLEELISYFCFLYLVLCTGHDGYGVPSFYE